MADVDEVLTAAARICFAAGEHGDFRGHDTLVAQLERRTGPDAVAWLFALRAIRWSFDPGVAPRPEPADVRRFIEHSAMVRHIAARGCAVMERVCVPTFDSNRLAAWLAVHAALVSGTAQAAGADVGTAQAPGRSDDIVLASARLWHRLLTGDTASQDTAAKALFDEASRQKAAPQVIEIAVVRALLALSTGATDDAVELARRASRMAQSEALPQHEYLANVTLARVRRYSGRPHLALHILAALSRVAPPAWSGWLGWEMLLGGGSPERGAGDQSATAIDPSLADAPSTRVERDLRALFEAMRAGDRARFGSAAAALEGSAAAWPDLAREAQALLATVDPLRAEIPESAAAWCRGEITAIPCGLHGVGVAHGVGADTETATAFVLASPKTGGRRFLRPGIAFAGAARVLARDPSKSSGGGVRTETGIAALALAGDAGATREAFFASVYGFPFVAHRHQAVLDVLCHRMRSLLGDGGEVRRDASEAAGASPGSTGATGPSLCLVLREPVVVADMRCTLPTADRVLRALATLGTTSASSAADALRMPLRTVQAVLQQLVAEGACSIERDGRRVAYRIEDTTFTEVTSV